MSGTVRISQLSSVTNLSADDVIVVNVDGNTDTRTIKFSEFTSTLAPVKSINTVQPDDLGAVTLVPSNIGAASQVDLDALGQIVTSTQTQTTINNGLIGDNAAAIASNTTAILEHRALTGVDQLGPGDNLYTLIEATKNGAIDSDDVIKIKMGYDQIPSGDNLYSLIQSTASDATDAVAFVQADVDNNETAAAAAIAAVQLDVDNNEAAADIAIAQAVAAENAAMVAAVAANTALIEALTLRVAALENPTP